MEYPQNKFPVRYLQRFKRYEFEPMREFFQDVIQKPESLFLLVEDEGVPLGYAWVDVQTHEETAFRKRHQSLYVHQISIAESAQHKGYGSFLMDHICQMAKERGMERVELDYWCDNTSAKRFYEKQGFIKYREVVYKPV